MDTEQKIIQKAIELFKKLGIRNVTMDTLANELGISKRTIYELFKDKNNLVSISIQEMARQNREEVLEIINNSTNVIDAMFQIGRNGQQQRAEMSDAFFDDIKKRFPEINKRFNTDSEYRNSSVSQLLLSRGVNEGIFRSELNIELVSTFIEQLGSFLHNSEYFTAGNINEKEIMKNIFLPYFRGISTEKGVKLIEQYFSENQEFL
ncbi:MAG TPA: TetR/AcrR family transcriptional regulator [Bacteroidales bacterium]|nr:TetR/AcrR family transcriptional regulator [Bacteroidales bacterium]